MPIELVPDPPGGGVYATLADCRDYIATDTAFTDAQILAELDRAEHDVDDALVTPAVEHRGETGLKYDPAALAAWQAAALTRATCAQVEYRLFMGPEFFIKAQHEMVRGPDFATSGRLPYLGPKAQRELDASGLAVHSDSAASVVVSSPTLAAFQRLYPPS
jgi:hypothetical protein